MITATRTLIFAVLAASATCVLAVDARERSFIHVGMAQSEVLYRVGAPDYEGFVLDVKGQAEEKVWTYLPHYRDPQTLTIIKLRGGFVLDIERKIARTSGVDARERGFIRRGMTEGEVVYRIGKPDQEAFILDLKGQPELKTWTYLPHYRDPQTLTIITLRSGIVENIERTIAR